MEVQKSRYLAFLWAFIRGFTVGQLVVGLALGKGQRAQGAQGDQRDVQCCCTVGVYRAKNNN